MIKSVPLFCKAHVLLVSLCLIAGIGFFAPTSVKAVTMEQALAQAATILQNRGLSREDEFEMVLDMVNYDSKKLDREARIIQGNAFTALQNRFPNAKIILQSEAIAGVSGRAVYIKGTYQPKGDKIYVTLQAINQTSGQLIAKADVSYDSDRQISGDLVAVLSLQASTLNKAQVRIFSKVFRSELTKTGKMNLIASEYIDSADADKIQQEYQCSREECGTIIAQQLNASQVITPVYEKVTDNLCYLVASWKDIASGRTINEVSIEHSCQLETLGKAMQELACKLAGTCGQQPLITPVAIPEPEPVPEYKPQPQPEPIYTPEPSPEPETSSRSFTTLTLGVPIGYSSSDITITGSSYDTNTATVESNGSPSGYYVHLGFGHGNSVWGFSWLTVSQPVKADSSDVELYVNAIDFDWYGLIGGHFALGVGGGMNWSNIICDTCFWETSFGLNFLGKVGFVGDGFGLIYSMHIIGSSATRTYKDSNGFDEQETATWSATASVLSLVLKF